MTRIPDPIHGTIELTIFERDFVDRPDFQRLHYVLQQSVSYVAFPSNKNTRFPHSLGTAHVVGRLFSAGLSNSGPATLKAFVNDAADFLEKVLDEVMRPPGSGGGVDNRQRNNSEAKSAKDAIPFLEQAHSASISGRSGFLHTPLMSKEGRILAKTPKKRTATEDRVGRNKQFSASFVIDTYWQALRIYALAHDIGHLPMSHAFEEALEDFTKISDQFKPKAGAKSALELYDVAKKEYAGKLDKDELTKFLRLVLPIGEKLDRDENGIAGIIAEKALHEVRSYAILSTYLVDRQSLAANYSDFLPVEQDEFQTETESNWLDHYCRLIHHLSLAIVYSYIAHKGDKPTGYGKTRFLYAIRQIVDGQVDGDRLDYTLRDCRSAGANFGEFDLDRVVSNAILVNDSDEPDTTPGPFAFGFGPRAIAGIEQFFESRYQSYRYLVHHRTASRSNVLIELLLQKLYEFAYRFPESDCAMVMHKLGFIRRETIKKKWCLTEILPDPGDDGEDLDDASLRVLMKRCRSILRKPGNFEKLEGLSKERGRRAREIDTLIEIILNRSLQHTFTLFKDETVDSFLSKRLGVTDKDEQKDFFSYVTKSGLGSMLNDLNKDLAETRAKSRKEDIKALSLKSPVLICAETIKPKCFSAKDIEQDVFEELTWVVDPSGDRLAIDTGDVAPTLKSMGDDRAANVGLRIYGVSADIKSNGNLREALEALVIDRFRQMLASRRAKPTGKRGKKTGKPNRRSRK